MRKIAVAMAKGGVGKTTTAVNLAHGLALQGHRVLLVDCDTQAQASKFLGVSPVHGMYEFVTGHTHGGEPVLKKEAVFRARHSYLRRTLVPKGDNLDYIIFDCAPGWDVLSVNVLMAAEEVMCPVALQGPALEGLKTFFGYLISVQKQNEMLSLKYVLPTMFDRRTRQSFEIYRKLRRLFAKQICEPIRHNVRLCEAATSGKTIHEYAGTAPGAEDYRKLSRRLIDDGIRAKQVPRFF
jgi:chromosome partitioning protein